jgi:hypothetical protein
MLDPGCPRRIQFSRRSLELLLAGDGPALHFWTPPSHLRVRVYLHFLFPLSFLFWLYFFICGYLYGYIIST